MTSPGTAASPASRRRACDQSRGTDPPHSCRQMLLWRGGIRRGGRVPLCRELPLLQLPADDRFGVQAIRRNRAREAHNHKGRDTAYELRRRRREQYPLQDLRLAALFGRPRRGLRSRRHGNSHRRSDHTAYAPYFRRLQSAVVYDRRRPAAVRGARSSIRTSARLRRVRRRASGDLGRPLPSLPRSA